MTTNHGTTTYTFTDPGDGETFAIVAKAVAKYATEDCAPESFAQKRTMQVIQDFLPFAEEWRQRGVEGARSALADAIKRVAEVNESAAKARLAAEGGEYPVERGDRVEGWEGSRFLGYLPGSLTEDDISMILSDAESASMARGKEYAEGPEAFSYEVDDGDGAEVVHRWTILFADGRRATIYDYKGHRWHIGGHHLAMVARVCAIFEVDPTY